MILDSRLEFADAQTITSTAASTNSVDLQDSPRHIGPGQPMYVVVVVHASDATDGNETYAVEVQTDDVSSFDSALETLGSINVPRGSSEQIFVLGFPYTNKRHLRLRAVLGGTTPSLQYSAYLTDQEPASWRAYKAPSQA